MADNTSPFSERTECASNFTGGSIAASSISGTISAAIDTVAATINALTSNTVTATNVTATNALFTNATTTNATTTNLFVSATTTTVGLKVTNIANCTEALETDALGNVVCGSDATAAGAANAFVFATNYGAINAATTSPLWAQNGINASSTSHLVNLNFTAATSTGLSYFLGGLLSSASSTVNGAFTVTGNTTLATSLTGPLQAIAGLVSASSSLSDFYVSNALTISAAGSVDSAALTNFGTPFYQFFSATNTDALGQGSVNRYYADTLVQAFIHSSTTIPKMYSSNTFTGSNTFSGVLTLTGLNGPLDARNGVVGATTSIGILYGGTGATTAAGARTNLAAAASGANTDITSLLALTHASTSLFSVLGDFPSRLSF
jgi:hypothetical protein